MLNAANSTSNSVTSLNEQKDLHDTINVPNQSAPSVATSANINSINLLDSAQLTNASSQLTGQVQSSDTTSRLGAAQTSTQTSTQGSTQAFEQVVRSAQSRTERFTSEFQNTALQSAPDYFPYIRRFYAVAPDTLRKALNWDANAIDEVLRNAENNRVLSLVNNREGNNNINNNSQLGPVMLLAYLANQGFPAAIDAFAKIFLINRNSTYTDSQLSEMQNEIARNWTTSDFDTAIKQFAGTELLLSKTDPYQNLPMANRIQHIEAGLSPLGQKLLKLFFDMAIAMFNSPPESDYKEELHFALCMLIHTFVNNEHLRNKTLCTRCVRYLDELLSEMGDPKAKTRLANYYENGQGGLKASPEKALKFLKEAVKQDCPEAFLELGRALLRGNVKIDNQIGIALSSILVAEEAGVLDAKVFVAFSYANKCPALPNNPDRGLELLKEAAYFGSPAANQHLAEVYEKGKLGSVTVPKSPETAKMLREDANNLSARRQNNFILDILNNSEERALKHLAKLNNVEHQKLGPGTFGDKKS